MVDFFLNCLVSRVVISEKPVVGPPFFSICKLAKGGLEVVCVSASSQSRAFCHKCKKREKAVFDEQFPRSEESVARGAWQSLLHAGRMREI